MLIFGYDDCLVRMVLFHEPRAEVCSFLYFGSQYLVRDRMNLPKKDAKIGFPQKSSEHVPFHVDCSTMHWETFLDIFLRSCALGLPWRGHFQKLGFQKLGSESQFFKKYSEIIRTRSFPRRLFQNAWVNIYGYFFGSCALGLLWRGNFQKLGFQKLGFQKLGFKS